MFPHEIHKYSAGYDDYDNDNIGKSYWTCPVCHVMNWLSSGDDYDGY